MLRMFVAVVALTAACKRVERLPSEPASTQPSPAALELSRGPAPPQPAQPTPANHPPTQPVPNNNDDPGPTPQQPDTPKPPDQPIPQLNGCPADRIANLSRGDVQLPDCSDEARCRADCVGGSAASCFAYASVIQNNPARRSDVAALFGRSCELGMAIACTNFGASLWSPTAHESDVDCARRVFEKACGVKEPYACGMLGRMAVANATDDASRALARQQLEKTCNELSGPPCKMLADYLKAGKLGPFEPAQVQALLERACDGGDGMACQDIGRAPQPQP